MVILKLTQESYAKIATTTRTIAKQFIGFRELHPEFTQQEILMRVIWVRYKLEAYDAVRSKYMSIVQNNESPSLHEFIVAILDAEGQDTEDPFTSKEGSDDVIYQELKKQGLPSEIIGFKNTQSPKPQ